MEHVEVLHRVDDLGHVDTATAISDGEAPRACGHGLSPVLSFRLRAPHHPVRSLYAARRGHRRKTYTSGDARPVPDGRSSSHGARPIRSHSLVPAKA